MAPPTPRPPRIKPLLVRLAHGGEVGFHGDAAALRKTHPGAEIVSFLDGTEYVKAEQDAAAEAQEGEDADGANAEQGDTQPTATKGGGKAAQAKAAAGGEKTG